MSFHYQTALPFYWSFESYLISHFNLSTSEFVTENSFWSNPNGRHYRCAFVRCCFPRAPIGQKQLFQTIPPSSNHLSPVLFSRTLFDFHSCSNVLPELTTSSWSRPWPLRVVFRLNGRFILLSPFPFHIVALFSIKLTPLSRFFPTILMSRHFRIDTELKMLQMYSRHMPIDQTESPFTCAG